jgi:Tol biopolymer transport system component
MAESTDVMARLAGMLVCAALVAGCSIFRPNPDERGASRLAMSQIAYVGSDDHIYIAEVDGSSARQMTGRVTGLSTDQGWTYRWPTYSPDGRRLAFAGYRTGASQLLSSAVLVADVGQTNATAMLESAGIATVYLYWSPDSRHLAALLQHGTDLELQLFDASAIEPPRRLLVGQPLYWSWAPDASTLAVHVGGAGSSGSDAWIGLLHIGQGGAREERFADAPGDFRAPAWSPSGAKLAYAGLGGGASLLTVRDVSGQVTHLASSTSDFAFNWSPSGDWLAFAAGDPGRPGLYQGLEVAHPDGSERHRLSQDPVAAFYWSPDATRLAVVGIDTGARALTWSVVTVDGKTRRALSTFVPSSDFAFQLPFFDQYAQSTSVWSADGKRLVYGADSSGDRSNGSGQGEHVVVLDADGQASAAVAANGGAAVWSPPRAR